MSTIFMRAAKNNVQKWGVKMVRREKKLVSR